MICQAVVETTLCGRHPNRLGELAQKDSYQLQVVSNIVIGLYQGSLIDLSIVYPRCRLCSCLLWRAIEFEDALHWLSTLGGAFSNLGEGSYNFVSAVDKTPNSNRLNIDVSLFRH